MKIIYVYRGIPALTQAIHIEGLIRELSALGHQVEPCFPVPQSEAGIPSRSSLTRALQWTRERVPAGAWNLLRLYADARTARRLRRLVVLSRPAAIYERYVCLSGACSRVAHDMRVPHVLEVNETARLSAETWSRRDRARAYQMEDQVFSRTSAIVTITEILREHIISLGLPPGKVTVMHNGVHAADFADSASRREETRRRHQIRDQFAVGYVQSWHTTASLHGEILQTLLPFAREVLSAIPSAVLVMIGGGAASKQVRDQVQAAVGAAHIDRLRFAGAVSHREIPAVLAALDVGIVLHHSRYYFTSPLKLYEYMAAGAVCIASDLPNHREMIDDGVTGILYPPGDVHALVAAVRGLASDSATLRRLANAGRQHVLAEHTWGSNARRVVEIMRELGAGAE